MGRKIGKTEISAWLFTDFASILDADFPEPLLMMADMPIGLANSGRRSCEALTRAKLGPRRASVFVVPRRPMLALSTYEQANQWGKAQEASGGLSKQAWNILPKIREIDEAITPDHQAFLGEAHPELAFTRLGGRPCRHNKKSKEGQAERASLLQSNGIENLAKIYQDLRQKHGADALTMDDLHDACVLTFTAEARARGNAWRLSDDAKDARGLIMEIWG